MSNYECPAQNNQNTTKNVVSESGVVFGWEVGAEDGGCGVKKLASAYIGRGIIYRSIFG
jgi:hypothetical protein